MEFEWQISNSPGWMVWVYVAIYGKNRQNGANQNSFCTQTCKLFLTRLWFLGWWGMKKKLLEKHFGGSCLTAIILQIKSKNGHILTIYSQNGCFCGKALISLCFPKDWIINRFRWIFDVYFKDFWCSKLVLIKLSTFT